MRTQPGDSRDRTEFQRCRRVVFFPSSSLQYHYSSYRDNFLTLNFLAFAMVTSASGEHSAASHLSEKGFAVLSSSSTWSSPGRESTCPGKPAAPWWFNRIFYIFCSSQGDCSLVGNHTQTPHPSFSCQELQPFALSRQQRRGTFPHLSAPNPPSLQF